VSAWPSAKARRVLAALFKPGWQVKRQSGSHRTLSREGWADVVFAFHDGEEIGPRTWARLSRPLRGPFALPLSKNHSVQGSVTV
jgi:predicted RNA binding protein YcfA (HicA-like mRNA interferase family)